MDAQNSKLTQIITHRFTDFVVADNIAKKRLGLINTTGNSSEVNRSLLSIEAKALEAKERKAKTAEEFLVYINEYFHDVLFNYIDNVVENKSVLFSDTFKIDATLAKLLKVCLSPNASANQIAELVAPLPALKKELLSIVNKPPFRDPKSTRPLLDNVMLAIRYVGPDNIKMPIIALIAKQWQPHSTEPFSETKVKLWQYSVAVANCMEQTASTTRLPTLNAYLLGLVHGVGYGLALRLYLRSFEKVRINEMKKARKSGRPDIEKALDALKVDGEFASDIIFKHGLRLSTGIMEQLEFEQPFFVEAMEMATAWPESSLNDEQHPQSAVYFRLLVKSITYGQYKILQKARLIELNEAKRFLTNAQINNEFISHLNQVDLTKLNLTTKHI